MNCKSAPESYGARPIEGHLPMLIGPQILHMAKGALADEYGAVFTIRLEVMEYIYKTLVVSSWEVAKECFSINGKVLATKPSSVTVRVMGYSYDVFAFAPYGSY
ncbi:Cytochrome p450 [Thalictrum thalictroides]|uniref:Cytochrome p450 n=1 Tax=Thalictrum thalictroides TaxID=46969 RepID=A0A7J6VYD4_THATH|nr:Cytochrome p450 [Thalictrum thalictroides]